MSPFSDVPVEQLDYDFLRSCNDPRKVEKILTVLRSGKEGVYPDLITFAEKRLVELNPTSRLLRKPSDIRTRNQLSETEKSEIDHDLNDFLKQVTNCENKLSQDSGATLPPIRTSQVINEKSALKPNTGKQTNTQRIKSYDYREWDKFNVERECEKIDEEPPFSKTATISQTKIQKNVDKSVFTEQERKIKADREREKGNEAYRAGDISEALAYYTRSLGYQQSVAAYNNRALVYLKSSDYKSAINDCSAAMKLEPNNVKSLFRRAQAFEKNDMLNKSINDLEKLLCIEPSNKKAQTLLKTVKEKCAECEAAKPSPPSCGGRRIAIEDVDGEEGSDDVTSNFINDSKSQTQDENNAEKSIVTENCIQSNITAESSVNKECESGSLDFAISEDVMRIKTTANEFYRSGRYSEALSEYSNAIQSFTNDNIEMFPHAYSILLANRATCHYLIGQLANCISDATLSLKYNSMNFKALHRRSMAFEAQENFERAFIDVEKVLSMKPKYVKALNSYENLKKLLVEKHGSNFRVLLHDNEGVSNSKHNNQISNGKEQLDPAKKEKRTRIQIVEASSSEDEAQPQATLSEAPAKTKTTPPRKLPNLSSSDAYDFVKTWNAVKNSSDFVEYAHLLRQVDDLSKVLNFQLNGNILKAIIHAIASHFLIPEDVKRAFKHMECLTKVNRFAIVLMFLSKSDSNVLSNIFDYFSSSEHFHELEIQDLKSKYNC